MWPRHGRVSELEVDYRRTRRLDADATFLLSEDLRGLERTGARVRLRGLNGRLRRSLRHHPLLLFAAEDEDLFTDPDLEGTGFRPSRS